MSDIDKRSEIWVLEAKVDLYRKALAESQESDRGNVAAELEALRVGVRGLAKTLRTWAVAAGGHTPSAIVASRLLELIGDEKAPPLTEAEVAP